MAYKIIWSLQARQDLRDIVRFIARDNQDSARSFGFRLISKVESLAEFPRLGRAVPEAGDELIREVVLRPYRIIYLLNDAAEVVAIARVWHGARGEPQIPEPLLD